MMFDSKDNQSSFSQWCDSKMSPNVNIQLDLVESWSWALLTQWSPALPYLSEQQFSNPADSEVGGAALHQTLLPPVQQLWQESWVPLQQLVQTGEDGVNHSRLQHHLLLHPPPVHPFHDPQRPNMVKLCLDQLWETDRGRRMRERQDGRQTERQRRATGLLNPGLMFMMICGSQRHESSLTIIITSRATE